jgi:AbrB family looped-hinge helix DNA binding protein
VVDSLWFGAVAARRPPPTCALMSRMCAFAPPRRSGISAAGSKLRSLSSVGASAPGWLILGAYHSVMDHRSTIGAAVARTGWPWHHCIMDAMLVLGQQGRLVIPAEIRSALGLAPGDQLHLRLVGHSLVLQRRQDAAAELRGLASGVPRTRSLVDELLEERRLAAAAGE